MTGFGRDKACGRALPPNQAAGAAGCAAAQQQSRWAAEESL